MNVNCTTTVPRSNYYSILKKRKLSYKENVTVKLKRHSIPFESDSRLDGDHSEGESKYPKCNHSMCVICRKQTEYMINRRYDPLSVKHLQEEQQHHLQSKQQNDMENRQNCTNSVVETSSIMYPSEPSPTTAVTTTKWDRDPLQIANQQSQSEWNVTGVRSSWCNSIHHCSRSCSMPSCQPQSTSYSSVGYAVSETPSLSSSSSSSPLSSSSIGALPSSCLPQSPLPVVPHQPSTSATCSLSLLRPSLASASAEAVATKTTTNEISSSSLSGSSQPSSRTNALLSCNVSLSLRRNGSNTNSSTGYSASFSSSGKCCSSVLTSARVTNVMSVSRTFAFVTVMLEKCFTELFGTRHHRIPSSSSEHEIDNQVKTRRQSKQSNTNSFTLPKFPLIFTFLLLSLMTSMLPTSVGAEVRLQRKEYVCKSKDIRNSPDELYQLTDCTVIEGFLLITLIDAKSTEYQKHSYPLLTEVTEFVMIYHVNGLRSLSTLFPNLSVIRGKNLFEGYALVLYDNRDLEDVGLPSLITVARGAVRIEKNIDMCFVNTIDWSEIAVNMTNDQHFFRENKAAKECPLCPGDRERDSDRNELNLRCPVHQGKRHCWNSRICQKICPLACKNNCNDDLQCCDDACIGGCDKLNKSSCSSCRHLANTTVCMEKCPPNFFSYQDRRCITAETCTNVIGMKLEGTKPEYLVPFNGTCSVHCPPGYNKVGATCKKCDGKCEKKCEGRLIDSVGAARQLHGCTHIYGSALTISIKQGGRHLMEELEMGLSSIEVIDTYLKVHRTYGLVSLAFFKNLKVIKGQVLESGKFVLYVLENQDLETIWGPNQTVKMEEGRVYFHFNPKLCFAVIDSIRPSLLKNSSDFEQSEVARDSNGSKGSCNTDVLVVEVQNISSNSAYVVITNPMKFEDDRVLIGYQFFHTVDPYGNVSMYGHKPCDERWSSEDPTKEVTHVFTSLKPYTQYAFYVKTNTISSEMRNGQSDIIRFRTRADQPKSVQHLEAFTNSSSEIVIKWQRPLITNGNLTKYIIQATLDDRDADKLKTRNYCAEPLPVADTRETPPPKVEKTVDCVCENNVTRKDGGMPQEEEEYYVNAIDFENNIQNFVYVKQTNDTLPDARRRRRAVDFSSVIWERVARSLNQLDENDSQNDTNMDMFGNYYIRFTETVNVSQFKEEKFVLKKLKHFSSYTITVKACRAPEEGANLNECSAPSQTVMRTQKLNDVDVVRNLDVKIEQSNTTRGNLRIKWDPPERPNSIVVSYTIHVTPNSKDAVSEKRCITEPDYQQNFTNGYLITGLSTGNYSVQVQANSLAGEGNKTDPFYVYIQPDTLSAQTITLIIVTLSLICIIFGGGVYYFRKKFMAPPTDLKIFPTVNPYYISMQYLPDEWEVPREKIIQLGALGQGSFGMVYEGILKNFNNEEDTPCAIKTVNESATDRERLNFLKEASVMKQFNTHHVVRLLGVCSRGQPAFVIMELMKNGDLKAYLRQHRPGAEPLEPGKPPMRPPTLSRILQIAIEIADGMAYLAAKKFVHRDLAARNCMVAADLTVKIGDFGMTRDIYETDYYRKGTKGLLPVRWMAPESLKDGVFSSASDVFSYGVVLWEMATLAAQPYQGLSNEQVLHFVIDGGVMARPDNCPDKLYKLMQRCWEHRPSARPPFMEIIRYLLDSADPKFQEVSFYHSAEAKDILDQLHPKPDLDDVRTPLRVDEFDNSSVEQHDSRALDEEDEDDDEIVQPHSPYSLGSATMINSSTPGGHSKNSSNIKINQSNPSLSLPSTSAAAITASIATNTTENVVYVQPDPLYQYNNDDHKQMEQNENCKFIEDDTISSVNNVPPEKKAIKNKSISSSNTSKYPNSLKRAVASTVQNVSNSLVPLRITNMNFLHHRLFKNNSNSTSSGGKGKRSNTNTKSDTTNSNNGNNNTSNTMIANAETGSTGSRSFFSALTPSHTSKNPNYQILNESINIAPDEQYSLDDRQPSMESPQQVRSSSGGSQNINKNDGNNAMKEKQKQLNNETTEQCNLSRDSAKLGSNSNFKDTKPSQSIKNQPTNTSTAHELSSSSGVSSPIRIKDNRHTSNTPTVISTSTPLTTKTPYQLKENWLKQLPQVPPPNGFIGREG